MADLNAVHLPNKEHAQLKLLAAVLGTTVKSLVLEAVRARIAEYPGLMESLDKARGGLYTE